jgi:hypothetical protein
VSDCIYGCSRGQLWGWGTGGQPTGVGVGVVPAEAGVAACWDLGGISIFPHMKSYFLLNISEINCSMIYVLLLSFMSKQEILTLHIKDKALTGPTAQLSRQ